MAKTKLSVSVADDRLEVLASVARSLGLTDGAAAGLLLTAALASPGAARRVLAGSLEHPGSTSPGAPGGSLANDPPPVPESTPPAPGEHPASTPPGAGGNPTSSLLFSSLPEKKKRKKTEAPTTGAEEFARGWAGYAERGGRLGSKSKAVESWNALIESTGWTPAEAVRRWAIFTKHTQAQFLPEVHRLLRPSDGKLTDDALRALEVRARAEKGAADRRSSGPVDFDGDSYEATIARRMAASQPIAKPSPGARGPGEWPAAQPPEATRA